MSFLPSVGSPLLRGALFPYRRRLAAGLLLVLLGVVCTLSWPWLLRQAIDGLTAAAAAGPVWSGEVPAWLGWQALGIVLLACGDAICRFGSRLLMTTVSRQAEFDLRERLFAHLLKLDATYFQQIRVGDLMARATNDLSAVRQLLGPGIQNLFNTALMFGAALTLMAGISVRLALGAALLLPTISLVFGLFRSRVEARYLDVQNQFAALNAQAEENLAGIRVVKAYAQERSEAAAFRAASLDYVVRTMAQVRLAGLLWPLMGLLSGLAMVMLLLIGGRDVIAGSMSVGQYVQFSAYLGMLTWPMIALGWVMNLFQQGFAALVRVQAVFDARSKITPAPSARLDGAPLARAQGGLALAFERVSLQFNATQVLRDVSFDLPGGALLGLVGPTGAGKSLLLALLVRHYDPSSGRILLGGRDLRDWPLDELRRAIGFVQQETTLFSRTLRENISLGLDDPPPERLNRAVALARLDQDLPQLPAGLETLVGERGVTLSGGQKQRTAIARALLREPSLLVLDDALSSVDAATEAAVLAGLRQFMRGRTSVVATHRISTVRQADLILVLDDGQVVERGTHSALLERGGLYSRLDRRQRLSDALTGEDDSGNGHRRVG